MNSGDGQSQESLQVDNSRGTRFSEGEIHSETSGNQTK